MPLQLGKAKVLTVELDGTDLRVTLASRNDRDIYVEVMRALSAPGSTVELVNETTVLCKLPPLEKLD